MKLWLRDTDGHVYDWNAQLARHPRLTEVTDEEMFPEKYASPAVSAKIAEIKEKNTEQLGLFTADIPEEPAPTNEELNAEVTVRTRKRGK